MGTTTEPSAVVVRSFEQQLNDLLLGARNALPHGRNGRAYKAPPKAIASTRKMITQGLCRPFKHIVEVCDESIDADAPVSEVNAALYKIIARNEARAADRHLSQSSKPLPVLTSRVQQEMGELSLAMLRQANSPESIEAAEAVLREAADIPPVLEPMTRAVGLRVIRATTRSVRRPTMELAR